MYRCTPLGHTHTHTPIHTYRHTETYIQAYRPSYSKASESYIPIPSPQLSLSAIDWLVVLINTAGVLIIWQTYRDVQWKTVYVSIYG